MNFSTRKIDSGSALLITIVILSVVIAIAAGIASIFVREIRLSVFVDDSVIAIMAADAGVEKKLYDIRKLGGLDDTIYTRTLSNGAEYITCPTAPSCQSGGNPRFQVDGYTGSTKRALEVTNYR